MLIVIVVATAAVVLGLVFIAMWRLDKSVDASDR